MPNWLDFDLAFPSLIKTAIRLRDARNAPNPDILAIISIAEIFISSTQSTIHEIHKSFVEAHIHLPYHRCKSAAEHAISLTHDKIKIIRQDATPAAIDTIYCLGDIVIANLKELLRVAVRLTKPLPPVPTNPQKSCPTAFDYELVDSDVSEESYNLPSYKFLFGNKLRGLFKSTSTLATSSEHFASLASDGYPSARIKKRPNVPYVLRQSTYFLGPPTEDKSSSQGRELKGASFPELVQMLTSKHAILDPDFIPAFFAGVRDFGSVKLLYQELKKRFDETAPDGLETEQLKAWTREAYHVRIRVAKVLLLWLTDYWQPSTDGTILGPLHTFAVERLCGALPGSVVTPLLEMIDSRMTGDELYIPSRHFKFVASRAAQSKTDPTGFSYPDKFDKDVEAALTLFNTELGREEFVQQLTAMISAMFHKINPQHVVKYWHTHSDSKLGPSLSETTNFARSFAMFVTHSILTQQQRDQRCRRIEFWVNIATICLHYRNYFSSRCVFAGITHSAVNRLKQTILELPKPVKMQFRRLDQFFSGHLNHVQVRKAMDEKTAATIPLLVPLKQNITSLKQVPPVVKANEHNNEKTMINLIPYRVLMKTIRAMESALIPYGIPENPRFGGWLKLALRCYPVDKEEKLYNAFYGESCRIEPKTRAMELPNDPWLHHIEVTRQGKKIIRELDHDEELSN